MNTKGDTGIEKGTNYLGAMRIAVQMIDTCETYTELLQLLGHLSDILHGDEIEAIFPLSE